MPWDYSYRKNQSEPHCVIKKTTGKVMKCYSDKQDALDYLAALEINASEHKDLLQKVLKEDLDSYLEIKELDDGRYWIVAIATAALKDREKETYDIDAMDYDIAVAKETNSYPLFTMWHNELLAVGKVEKMSRVGLFAVDEGPSYDDPFSLAVCKNILSNNSGKWGISRGFYVLEASGMCPVCESGLIVGLKQMVAGFKCPNCKTTHLHYKGVLKEVHFRKTRTFEDTITDIPAVPYTGVAAYQSKKDANILEVVMTKEQLKQKLLKEGVPEDAIDARLSTIGEKELKELGNEIPFAKMLKEFEDDDDDEPTGNPELFVLDPEVLKDFSAVVKEEVQAVFKDNLKAIIKEAIVEAFDDVELELGGEGLELKELPGIDDLKASVDHITEVVDELVKGDGERLKDLLSSTSRSSKFRILRSTKEDGKKYKGKVDEEEEEEEGEEEKKQLSGVVVTGDGQAFESMTQALQ